MQVMHYHDLDVFLHMEGVPGMSALTSQLTCNLSLGFHLSDLSTHATCPWEFICLISAHMQPVPGISSV